jgi:hypothetical protein
MNLDAKSIKILRCFIKNNNILTLEQLIVLTRLDSDDILERLVHLWKNRFIRVVDYEQPHLLPEDGEFQITMDGKIYMAQRPKTIILTWMPMFLSIIAIFISIISLFR